MKTMITAFVLAATVAGIVALNTASQAQAKDEAKKIPANPLPTAALKIFNAAKTIDVVSVDPVGIGGYKEIGRTTIKDAKQRKQVIALIGKDISAGSDIRAACFNPRHLLQAEHDGKKAELVICYQCSGVLVKIDGKQVADLSIANAGGKTLMNKLLTAAGVKLAD